jgi:hypothetical protein
MTWEKDGNFKTLDDILAYGAECAKDERENVVEELRVYEERLLVQADLDRREQDFLAEDWRQAQAETVHDCVNLIEGTALPLYSLKSEGGSDD